MHRLHLLLHLSFLALGFLFLKLTLVSEHFEALPLILLLARARLLAHAPPRAGRSAPTIAPASEVPAQITVSLAALPSGTKVLKFGEPIGTLTAPVPLGGYVHTQNLESDYLHTHARGAFVEKTGAASRK